MRLKILVIAIILLPQFIYAQEPKMEITLRDIYEEMKTFKEEHQKDMLEIKQTLARNDEQFKAIGQRFNSIEKRLDTQIYTFWTTIILLVGLLAGIFRFIFVKISQMGERMSSLETLITGDIKPAKQKVMEMAFKKTEEFKVMQDDNKRLKEEVEKMQAALKKANILD